MKRIIEYKSMKFKRSAFALMAMSVVALAIVSGASSNPNTTNTTQSVSSSPSMNGTEVKIDNFVFNPAVIVVKAGTKVVWTNKDDIPHTVDSTDGKFKSNALDTEDKFEFNFTAPGEYPFFCRMHPKMTGKVVVQP
jgi:plastocyanin